MNTEYVTSQIICKIYKISPPTLRKWRTQGLPCFFLGRQSYRYDPQAVSEWLTKRR